MKYRPAGRLALVLVVFAAFAGCSDSNPVGTGGPFILSGTVTAGGDVVADAVVTGETDLDVRTDTTDAAGLYRLEFAGAPDSVRVCVSATGYADTCSDLLEPSDTLTLDWALQVAARDTIWITTDSVAAGETAVLYIGLANPDSAIASMNIWLRSAEPGIVFDTLTPVSPRYPVTGLEPQIGRHDSVNTFSLLVVDFLPPITVIPTGTGPLFEVRYTVDPQTPAGTYAVDTTSLLIANPLDIAYPSGLSVPRVVYFPGAVVVK